ncbi:Histidine--tRNA ligase [Rickettsiales endosymbiont of Paramecium tredecaurelia]|uniref:histidine--tRNA ligase n=1 Tax=Candidatus Sarmatiella mevalonica TaxID=2770581 RepID=UPI001922E485|nr:histidine--tRNA ligase [Candidatus Sarmatiella mevalonica]MBL3284915.1 Histidine--tRNA ligase [Candidatus Sarmatiella mevalonica]
MLTNISGFPEFLPQDQIIFNRVLQIIRTRFESHNFLPLDTPAVERVDTLLAKGNDNEIYGLYRLAHKGGGDAKERDLALRFDLTVPLARYVAQHHAKLFFPYKRYHIAPVWRGERAQTGRYRQFYQCDIDVIDSRPLTHLSDAEGLFMVYDVLSTIGLTNFIISLNHYQLLTGLVSTVISDQSKIQDLIAIIDKRAKISNQELQEQMSVYLADDALDWMMLAMNSPQLTINNASCFEYIRSWDAFQRSVAAQEGLFELQKVHEACKAFGIPDKAMQVNPFLARGLNYYTGVVAEARALDFPELGSIAGGGRYDNLTSYFVKNKTFAGVGFSIGISRLIPRMIEDGILGESKCTLADVLVTVQDVAVFSQYVNIAKLLRASGLNTELYSGCAPLGSQIKYADKKGIRFVIIANADELRGNDVILKDLEKNEQRTISIEQLVHNVLMR